MSATSSHGGWGHRVVKIPPRPPAGYRPEGHVPEPVEAPSTPGPIAELHQPRRGDEVEAFLKGRRDLYPEGSPEWHAIDGVLDDYRLCAYTGLLLSEVDEAGPRAPGEE